MTEKRELRACNWWEPELGIRKFELHGYVSDEDHVYIDCTGPDLDVEVRRAKEDGTLETKTWKLWELLKFGIDLARGEIE